MERQTIVAFGVLGVVIALLGAVAVVRVSDAGGFRGALTSDWLDYGSYDDYDEYDECFAAAEDVASGDDPYAREVTARYEGASEQLDGQPVSWSMRQSAYADQAAARSAFEALRAFDAPTVLNCLEDGSVEYLTFPTEVPGGCGIAYASTLDGERFVRYSASWQEGTRVVAFSANGSGTASMERWVRDRFAEAKDQVAVSTP